MVVLAVLVLILHTVPELVARYVIKRELDQMGIVSEGVRSLSIDPWRREAYLGTMRFGAGPDNQGQIGRVWVKFRLLNLLHEQAVIEKMIIDGVDVHITRETDGEITVNGINVSKLMAVGEDSEPAPADESGWGAGLDEFELRNSRVIFADRARGTLTLEVERLNLAGFRTFEPDQPGTFDLVAKLNEIPLHWRGEARPFADILTVAIDTEINDVDFAKIEAYTGPLGLERQAGVLNSQFTHNITIHPNGRIEVGSDGEIEIRNSDTLYPDLFSARYDKGDIGLDTSFVLDENGNIGVTGSLTLGLENWNVDAAETGLGGAAASIKIADFSLNRTTEGSLDFEAKPQLTIDQPKISGAANGKGARFTLDLSDLMVKQAGESLSVSTAGTTTVDALDLVLGEPKQESGSDTGEPVHLAFPKARLDLAKMLLTSKQGSLRLEAQPMLSVDTPSVDGPIQASTKMLKVDIADLKVEQAGDTLSTTAAGAITLGAVTSSKPVEARTDSFKVDLSSLKVEQTGDGLSVAVAGKSVLGSSDLSLPAEPSAGAPFGLAFTRAELDLTRMLLALKEGGLRLDAEPRLSIEAPNLRGPAEAAAERLDVALKTLDLTTSGDDMSVGLGGTANVSSLKASVAAAGSRPAMRMSAERVDTTIGEAKVANKGAEQHWQAQLDATVAAFAADLADGAIAKAKWQTLSLAGGHADQALNVGADTLELGGLEVDFNNKLFSAFGKGEADKVADNEAGKAQSPGKTPAIRLGKFVLSDNAKIQFRDTSVTPKVTIDVNVEKLEVSKLDTGNPSQKTDLQLAATVNEFTKLQLSGWSQAFAPEPSFDLKGQAKNVQLASYSPYAAQAIGLNLESGVLDADASGDANRGKLDGTVKLNILDLNFSPLSKADAERLSSKVGVPIETVVGLLEDSDGRINLKLPVSGTVANPDIDVSQAIGRAVGNALKSIFPPTAIASMLSNGFKGAGINFKDVPFAVGDATLSPQGEKIASNIAEMLKQRPKLRLRVCGRATAADFDAYMAEALGSKPAPAAAPDATAQATPAGSPQASAPAELPPASDQDVLEKARSALTNLATERGRAVRRYVVDNLGISASSLGECLPVFDSTDQKPPRAKVTL
jgi:outer membrane protein OmpA-like peptidoglycan-associated protein